MTSLVIFESYPLFDTCLFDSKKVSCAAEWSTGQQLLYGTPEGVFASQLEAKSGTWDVPRKVLSLEQVTHIGVMEPPQLLVARTGGGEVYTYPLEAFNVMDTAAALHEEKKISTKTTFFELGYCCGQDMICLVNSSSLSSTFKVRTLTSQSINTAREDATIITPSMQLYREFYIPTTCTGLQYMKTSIAACSTKGFELVDLPSLDMQSILNPSVVILNFAIKRKTLPKALKLFKIEEDFLLCYDEYAFYVDYDGKRSRPWVMITWKSRPANVVLCYPYILAISSKLIEVYHVDKSEPMQLIPGRGIRFLQSFAGGSVKPSRKTHTPEEMDQTSIASESTLAEPRSNQSRRDYILYVSDNRILKLALVEAAVKIV